MAAGRIEILVEVDPTGRGAAGFQTVRTQISGLSTGVQGVANSGSLLGSIFGGNLLYNYFKQGADAVIDFGKESVKAYAELTQDERFLAAQVRETGGSLAVATANAEKFDDKLALSRSNAEKLYAVTLQFTNEIGKSGQADKFITSLSDTLISHGVSPEKQADITRSLLAGRATELGKVLGKNVTAIEKSAAAAGGYGDFSKLDDSTKKLLLFNEVMKEGEKNTGAASQRLLEADGVLATLSARVDKAKESFGKFIIEETTVGDVARSLAHGGLSGLFEDILHPIDLPNFTAALKEKGDAETLRIKLIAKQRSDDLFKELDRSNKQYELTKDPSKRFDSFEFFAASQNLTPEQERDIDAKAKEAGDIVRKRLRTGGENLAYAAEGRAKLSHEYLIQPDTPEGDSNKIQIIAAARAKAIAEANKLADAAGFTEEDAIGRGLRLNLLDNTAKAKIEEFIKSYEKLFKDKRVTAASLTFSEQQYDAIKRILSPEQLEKLGGGLDEVVLKLHREAGNYLKGIRQASENLFPQLAERYAGDNNPLVKILTDGALAAKQIEKTYGVLGEAVVSDLKKIEAAHFEQLQLGAELDANLKASSLRQEAASLYQRKPGQLLGNEEGRLKILEARVRAAQEIPELEARAAEAGGKSQLALLGGAISRLKIEQEVIQARKDALLISRQDATLLRGGRLSEEQRAARIGALERQQERARAREQAQIQGKEFSSLVDLQRGLGGGGAGEFERQARGKISESLVTLFNSLAPETRARLAPEQRGVFAGAFQDQADERRRGIQDSILNAKLYDEQVQRARADVRLIKDAEGKGLKTSEVDARLLARTKELPENLLPPDLRRARFNAATREAERQTKLQTDAIEATKKSTASTDALVKATDSLAKAILDPSNRELLITLIDKSNRDTHADLYGDVALDNSTR